MPVFDLNKLSFNAGIWSEKLDARADLARYSAACSELINFIPHPYGGISNRAGSEFVFSGGNKRVRLISFQFNSEQSYIIALTAGEGRVLKDGGLVVDDSGAEVCFSVPYAQEDLQKIQYIQSADVLYLTHPQYRPAKLTRSSHVDWEFSYIFFTNSVPTPTQLTVSAASSVSDSTEYNYGITLVDSDDNEGELFEASDPARIGDTLNFGQSPEAYDCVKYNIYREKSGVFGWVDSTTGSSWVDPNEGGTNPDMDATPPIDRNPCPEEGEYPACACIHQGRLIFAGSNNKPRTIFGSRSGSFTDFSIRNPLQDDDSYEFEISGGQVDRINWLRSFNGVLLVGSGGGEYLVTGESGEGAITPNSVNVRQQTNYGSAWLPSLIAGATVLFVQEGKNIVRDMFYSLESDQYNGNDISVLAENLFSGRKLVALAWQRDPDYVLWAVRDDGMLLGLTYIKEQQVWAWHKHQTTWGSFVDVAVVRNNDGADDLYLCVKRGEEYYVEMLRSRDMAGDINKAWFLDSAVEYAGEPVTTLSGLEHLEGRKVSLFSEGAVLEDLLVSSGSITLPFPVREAVVGLGYSSLMSSMEVSMNLQGRNSMSVLNSIIGATIYFQDTCRVSVSATGGEDKSKWKDIGVSLQHDLASPYTLCSGKFYYTLSNEQKLADSEVGRYRIHLRCDLPLPVTVCAIGVRVNAGDM